MCSSFPKTTFKYTPYSLFFQLYGIIFIIYFWGYKMGKSIYLSRAEFSKISGVSQQSLSNMFKRFTAGTKTKYQFSENGEVIVSTLEYNRLVKLFRENEKKEIINSVEETKNNELINFFSKETKEISEINKKIEVQLAEVLEQNRLYKQHIEKQSEALNQLIKLTKEQQTKIKEFEVRKFEIKIDTNKINTNIDLQFQKKMDEIDFKEKRIKGIIKKFFVIEFYVFVFFVIVGLIFLATIIRMK